MAEDDGHGLSLLRDSLAECQSTVRSYDAKAQIVGIGYIFAMGIIGEWEALLNSGGDDINLLWVIIAWTIVMLPIILFGFVLYPSRV